MRAVRLCFLLLLAASFAAGIGCGAEEKAPYKLVTDGAQFRVELMKDKDAYTGYLIDLVGEVVSAEPGEVVIDVNAVRVHAMNPDRSDFTAGDLVQVAGECTGTEEDFLGYSVYLKDALVRSAE